MDSTHAPIQIFRLSKGWRAFLRLSLLAAIVLCAGGPIQWLVTTPEWSRPQLIALAIGMIIAGLTAVYLTRIARYQIELWPDRIRYQGAWIIRELHFIDVHGFRVIPTQYVSSLAIFPKDKCHKKIQLALTYENSALLLQWLNENLVNLDLEEHAAGIKEAAADETLGHSEEQRLDKLASARKWTRTLTFVTFIGCGWGFFMPHPYDFALGLLLVLPVLSLLLLVCHRGAVRFDANKNSAYPTVAIGFMMPPLVLMIRALMDWSILEWKEFWVPFSALGIALSIALWCTSADVRKKKAMIITGACFAFLYSYGAVIHLNCFYDGSTPFVYQCDVRDQRISRGKHTTHHFTLAPVVDGIPEREVEVPAEVYHRYQVGDTVQVQVRDGRLGIPWFFVR